MYVRGRLSGHVCVCWYAVEIDVLGAGFDGALGLGEEGGILGDPIYVIFGHSLSVSPIVFLRSYPLLLL